MSFKITVKFSDRIERILKKINISTTNFGYLYDIDWNFQYLPVVGDNFDWVSYLEDVEEYKLNENSLSREQYNVIDEFRHNCIITKRKWINTTQQYFEITIDFDDTPGGIFNHKFEYLL
ncbi:MAG: hypothetical protein KGV57_01340 [Fusobacterium sp.]|nr:hypothetical protein [Fusobacterium sp.]